MTFNLEKLVKKKFIACTLLLASSVTCSPVASMVKLEGYEIRTPTTQVKIYRDEKNVERPYEEMALLELNGRCGTLECFYNAIETRALEIGADGVIMHPNESRMEHYTHIGLLSCNSGTYEVRRATATAIRFTDQKPLEKAEKF